MSSFSIRPRMATTQIHIVGDGEAQREVVDLI
jgi:hypothetical protein